MQKNRQNAKKIRAETTLQSKIVMGVILLLGVFLLSLSVISAYEFDNSKSYNPTTKTVTIKNAFGLGETIAEVKLDSPQIVYVIEGKNRKVAEFTIDNKGDYESPLKQIELYNINKGMTKLQRNLDYKYKTISYKEVNDYKETCVNGKTLGNGTIVKTCSNEIIGTHQEEVITWNDFNEKTTLPIGKITIGIFTDVYTNDYVEWIPTLYGVRVYEWATWTASLNVGLHAYYNLSSIYNVYPPANHSLSGAGVYGNVRCLINDCVNIETSQVVIPNSAFTFWTASARNITINVWVNASALDELLFAGDTFNFYESGGVIKLDGFAGAQLTTPQILNQYLMLTILGNDTNGCLFANGTLAGCSTIGAATVPTSLGMGLGSVAIWDELGIWNRSLSPSEISDLYNNGAGLTFVAMSAPTIILNAPANNTKQSSNSVVFNWSSHDATEIINSSLFINGALNYTKLGSGTNRTDGQINLTFADGTYFWYVDTYDNDLANTVSEIRTLIIDNSPPSVIIKSPVNSSSFTAVTLPYPISFNWTGVDSSGFTNCWYANETSSVIAIGCDNNATINYNEGFHEIVIYANNSVGLISYNQTKFFINYILTNTTYDGEVFEGDTNNIIFNITGTSLSTPSVNITYNNTVYAMSGTSNGTFLSFNKSLSAPFVNADSWINFSIAYDVGSGMSNTGNISQKIIAITGINISSIGCGSTAYNLSLFDEENFTSLNGTVDYNIEYGTETNSTINKIFGSLTNVHEFYLCDNPLVDLNFTIGSAEFQYSAPNYVDRRYYIFSGTKITNQFINLSLYDLLSASQTSFKLEVEDTSLNPYVNKYTTLVRWYPSLNQYNVVDMGKTDELGVTVIHTRTEDVDYRIGVYELDGTLIKLADPTRMICLVDPCTYTLKVSPTEDDFTSIFGIDYTFNYNYTTGIWSFVYSDSSQRTQSMNLTVYKESGTQSINICSDYLTASAGALSCNTSLYTGTLRGIVVRKASPNVPFASKIVSIGTTAFTSGFGLFLTFLISIPIIFIFAFMSPIVAIIGGIVSLIPAFYFGSISIAILGGCAFLAGITIHFLKRIG